MIPLMLAAGRVWSNGDRALDFVFDLGIDLAALLLIVAVIYFPDRRDKEHAFMLITLNVVVFLVAHLLSRIDLGVGFAFGLFALFGILRYRTETVPVRDMSYLFAVIAIGLVNSVGQDELTYVDLILANGVLICVLFVLARLWWPRSPGSHELIYERIENIRPENRPALLADLRARTGLDITDVEINSINFLNDTAVMRVFYSRNGVGPVGLTTVPNPSDTAVSSDSSP